MPRSATAAPGRARRWTAAPPPRRSRPRRVPGIGYQRQGARRTERGNRDVDQEHRSPPEVRQQQPAEDWPKCDPYSAGPGSESDRPLPLRLITEHLRDDRQCGWHDQRAEGTGHRGQDASGDHPYCAAGHPSTLPHLIPAVLAHYPGGVLGPPWTGSLSSPPGGLCPQRFSAQARNQASLNQRPNSWPP